MSKHNQNEYELNKNREEMLPLRTIKSIVMRDVEALVNTMYHTMMSKVEEQINLQRTDIAKLDNKFNTKISHMNADIIKIKEVLDLKNNSAAPSRSIYKYEKLNQKTELKLRNQSADKLPRIDNAPKLENKNEKRVRSANKINPQTKPDKIVETIPTFKKQSSEKNVKQKSKISNENSTVIVGPEDQLNFAKKLIWIQWGDSTLNYQDINAEEFKNLNILDCINFQSCSAIDYKSNSLQMVGGSLDSRGEQDTSDFKVYDGKNVKKLIDYPITVCQNSLIWLPPKILDPLRSTIWFKSHYGSEAGKTGLLFSSGGKSKGKVVQNSQAQDPNLKLWLKFPDLNTCRECHTSYFDTTGKLQVMGGCDETDVLDTIEICDFNFVQNARNSHVINMPDDNGEMESEEPPKKLELKWVIVQLRLPVRMQSFGIFGTSDCMYLVGGKMENKQPNDKMQYQREGMTSVEALGSLKEGESVKEQVHFDQATWTLSFLFWKSSNRRKLFQLNVSNMQQLKSQEQPIKHDKHKFETISKDI